MRLSRLRLESYGHFAELDLRFNPAPGRVTLLAAPNGAGKSVLRQALAELLFGIHPQTEMGFSFGFGPMRLHAEAVGPGGPFAFARRKGRGNTVLDGAGRPAPPELLAQLPRDADQTRLRRLFVLDSAQLRLGGRALLQSDGDLADALLSGSGDLGSARALAAKLAAARDALAPERRSGKAPFYEAADQWGEAGKRVAAGLVRVPEVDALAAERAAAAATQDAANAQARDAAATLRRLGRIRTTRRHLDALKDAEARIAGLAGAPALPPQLGAALEAARGAVAAAEREAALATEATAAVAERLAGVAVDHAVLAEAEAIEALDEARGAARGSLGDTPKRQAELAEAEEAIARLLLELGLAGDTVLALRDPADIATARFLARDAAPVAAGLAAAQEKVDALLAAAAAVAADLAALPGEHPAALLALVDEATGPGDPALLDEAAANSCAAAAGLVNAALARVPGWSGGLDALLELPVPSDSTLARLDALAVSARTKLDAAATLLAELQAERHAKAAALAALEGAGKLPDAAALAAARAHRQQGWVLVAARLAGAPDPAAEARYGGIPAAFEAAMLAADNLADRRAAEYERIGKAAALVAEIAVLDDRLRAAAAEQDRLVEEDDGAAGAWNSAVAGLRLPEGAVLAEARALLQAREAAITAHTRLAEAEAHRARLATRHADLAARFAALMAQPALPLAALLPMARRRAELARDADAQRAALERTARGHRRALDAAEPALAKAEAAQAAWSAAWAAVLQRLNRPGGETPDATTAILDRLVELPARMEAAATAKRRLAEMADQLSRFDATTATLAARLGLAGSDPLVLSQVLSTRLTEARAAQTTHAALAGEAEAAEARRRQAQAAAADALRQQDAAVAATGAATLEEAADRVARAAERDAALAERDAALFRLAEDGDGLTPAELRAEADATPGDALAVAVADAEAASAAAQAQAQAAAAAAERANQTLGRRAESEDATRATVDRQFAAARMGRVLEDALVQHAAATMLEDALRQVEASSTANARLDRIGAVFRVLTGGAYDRVSPAEEDRASTEHGRLQAHAASGLLTHLAHLSEGTRDQLYLALRLVAIEDHVKTAPPLPFLADDILQTFDDARARMALEALVGLSRSVQVIVLTHHDHLVRVADGLAVDVVGLGDTA